MADLSDEQKRGGSDSWTKWGRGRAGRVSRGQAGGSDGFEKMHVRKNMECGFERVKIKKNIYI